jgi:hypothetical protein
MRILNDLKSRFRIRIRPKSFQSHNTANKKTLKINKSGAGIIAACLNAEDDSSPATVLLEPPVQKVCSATPQHMVHVFLKNHQIF